MNLSLIGRILGLAAGLLLQGLAVAPAPDPGVLTIVTCIALVVGGLVAGDRIARWVVRDREEAGQAQARSWPMGERGTQVEISRFGLVAGVVGLPAAVILLVAQWIRNRPC